MSIQTASFLVHCIFWTTDIPASHCRQIIQLVHGWITSLPSLFAGEITQNVGQIMIQIYILDGQLVRLFIITHFPDPAGAGIEKC